jgi:hypothetical protein
MSSQDGINSGQRYVFICGLHRSGTSVLGRNIARMENCTGFKDTGVIEDEGQFLQDVYPTGKVYGGAGKFGFDPRAHLTETSVLLTPENALKLQQSWERYWDQSKAIRVEKTPGNLLKTRFLQATFRNSYFIVIKRHPVAVSMANQKWKVSFVPLHDLFEHWLYCHALFEEDRKYLNHVYELSYEDYVRNPDRYHQEIARFIGTRVPEGAMENVMGAYNQKYFDRWSQLLNSSRFNPYCRYLAVKYESKFMKYGYFLTKGFCVEAKRLRAAEKISTTAGALYCLMANVRAGMVRVTTRSKGFIKNQLRTRLPEPLKTAIQRTLQRKSLIKKQPNVVSP